MKEILAVIWNEVRFIIATIFMAVFGGLYTVALLFCGISILFMSIGVFIWDDYIDLMDKMIVKCLRILGFDIKDESIFRSSKD